MTPLPFTKLPNALFDLMPDMSAAELRVVLAVCRQTIGWHKREDVISFSQLMELTGMSVQGVTNGIKRAIERGLIGRRRVGRGYAYQLVLAAAAEEAAGGAATGTPNVVGKSDVPHPEARAGDPEDGNRGITRPLYAVERIPNGMGRTLNAVEESRFPESEARAGDPEGDSRGVTRPLYEAERTLYAVEAPLNVVERPSLHGVETQKKGVVDDVDNDLSGYNSQQHVSFVPQRRGVNGVEVNEVEGQRCGEERGAADPDGSRPSRRERDPVVYTALVAAGVWPTKAGELAVTCELAHVEAWIRYIKVVPFVQNPPAMLVELLEQELEPPAWARRGYASPKEDPERFISGPYAEYIKH